ncbi:hypothetical protein D3C74_49850 [compost metagenome]
METRDIKEFVGKKVRFTKPLELSETLTIQTTVKFKAVDLYQGCLMLEPINEDIPNVDFIQVHPFDKESTHYHPIAVTV